MNSHILSQTPKYSMLSSLSIRNFILIESADLEFNSGFTVITGETGAGKSIVIDALLCALGERAQGDILKKGTEKGYVEAIFTIDDDFSVPAEVLSEGYCETIQHNQSATIIIRREFSSKGINRSFINDSPATASMARLLGESLIDFHGQHDHQSLLKVESHLTLLDDVAQVEKEKNAYVHQWQECKSLSNQYHDILSRKEDIIKNKEQVLYSLNEIIQIDPKIDELENLEIEFSKIKHSVYIQEHLQQILNVYSDEQSSLLSMIGKLKTSLNELASIDPDYHALLNELSSAHASLDEILRFVQSKGSDELSINPDIIQERMAKLLWLKKKYGSMERVFEVWDQLKQEAMLSEDIDGEISKLTQLLHESRLLLGKKGIALSKKRQLAIPKTEKQLEQSLISMGITSPSFTIQSIQHSVEKATGSDMYAIVDGNEFSANNSGLDNIEFLISLNPGEELKPLIKAASGGEISRIMLALKSIINQRAGIPSMVFDEIDTGISGKIARKVGNVMHTLSNRKQLIAISHSPQIASLADHHIVVKKTVSATSTTVEVKHINDAERIREIATLLSGENITETSMHTAKELLEANDIHQGKVS
ncbi:MAG: DNA repair protein RecN [Bacteroidetes bacterium]|nr:DNA repair protein RecN [Bacteroidota bacterium]